MLWTVYLFIDSPWEVEKFRPIIFSLLLTEREIESIVVIKEVERENTQSTHTVQQRQRETKREKKIALLDTYTIFFFFHFYYSFFVVTLFTKFILILIFILILFLKCQAQLITTIITYCLLFPQLTTWNLLRHYLQAFQSQISRIKLENKTAVCLLIVILPQQDHKMKNPRSINNDKLMIYLLLWKTNCRININTLNLLPKL